MLTLEQLNRPLRRSTSPDAFVGKLRDVYDSAVDMVAPQNAVAPLVTDAGMMAYWAAGTPDDNLLLPSGVYESIEGKWSDTAWRQVAERLNIPATYLFRLRDHGDRAVQELAALSVGTLSDVRPKSALFRWWRAGDGWELRAVLSDRFQAIDNWDVLRAVTDGMAAAEHSLMDCEVDVDWTVKRFRMRITIPSVAEAAPDLLADYRSPYLRPGEDAPLIWAGIEVSNSETGHGAFSVAPRAVVMKCRNGLTEGVNFRRTHIGGTLEQGVVDWSADTRHNALKLVQSQVTDAVRTFISPEYLSGLVDRMRQAKQTQVEAPLAAVQMLKAEQQLTDVEVDQMLNLFSRGGDASVLGLGHALTAAAAQATDGDRQAELETAFWSVVDNPARYASTPA